MFKIKKKKKRNLNRGDIVSVCVCMRDYWLVALHCFLSAQSITL